jgi:hypothetical protein
MEALPTNHLPLEKVTGLCYNPRVLLVEEGCVDLD